jgi:hypothetical protein
MRNCKPQHFNQRRVSTGRSAFYNEWLRQQPPERQRELVAAERGYLHAVDNPTGGRIAASVAYAESMRGPPYHFSASQLLDPSSAM